MSWGRRVAVALDVAVAAALWRSQGITISSHAALNAQRGKRWGCILCRWLDWLEKDHCAIALQSDIARAQAVIKELQA